MELTRRRLLGTAGFSAAAVAATPLVDLDRWLAALADAPADVRPSVCNGCSSHCGMLVHLKGGRVWKVTGHPEHGRSLGRLCARAHGAVSWLYDRDRLAQPLKRDGTRFLPISWDQALDEIAEKLRSILAVHGPGALFWSHNPRADGVLYGTRFMHALGAPTIVTHNAACNTALAVGFGAVFGATPEVDLANTRYLLLIGRNYAEGVRTSQSVALGQALAAGAKVVVVDPRHSAMAAIASEWIPVRPGADLALLLAMAHVLITENRYDAAFVRDHTTGFEAFREAALAHTPEWAAVETGIPAATIRRLAREMADARPHCAIDPSWKGAFGANYINSTDTARAVGCVNALLGNVGAKGGLLFYAGPRLGAPPAARWPAPPRPTVPRADGVGVPGEFPLAPALGVPQYLMRKAQQGKVKAGIVLHHNPVRNFPDPRHMEAGMQALDLLVVIDTHMTETAMQAHYVLPEPSFLEQEELVEGMPGERATVAMRTRVVPPRFVYTRPLPEIIEGLAKRLGIERFFAVSLEELNRARLAPHGVTLEDFRRRGSMLVEPTTPFRYGMPRLRTPSGKVEFASERFARFGFSAVPVWVPPKISPDRADPKAFRLIQGKQAYHSHTATANIPILLQITKDHASERIWIHPRRAARLGIRDGDRVRVISTTPPADHTVRAKVTHRIHPEAAFVPGGYNRTSPYMRTAFRFGINSNDFAAADTEPISGHAMMHEVVAWIEKA
jgi:thiosulfate reductase/polysulfide reductase chain A